MQTQLNKTIGELVAEDYRRAAIFKKAGIDFCCKGNLRIEEACEKKKMDPEVICAQLEAVENVPPATTSAEMLSPAGLADYIEQEHHTYVEAAIQQLQPYLRKVVSVHGGHHPELTEIEQEFNAAAGELAMHMKKEELILFPFIRKMYEAVSTGEKIAHPHFGAVSNPVQMMKEEHSLEGDRFERISKLSGNYTPPEDACNTFRVTYALLQEFEEDLHRHIHLENNILFPQALQLEQELFTDLKPR